MTHCELVLQALRDGQWHSSADIYRQCPFLILHSRISDLRARGHNVEGRHVPGKRGTAGYEYRMLPSVTFVSVPKVRRAVEVPPSLPPAEQLTLAAS